MISKSKNYKCLTQFCGAGDFTALLNNPIVKENCIEYQKLKKEYAEIKNQGKAEEANVLEERIKELKDKHPVFCFLGTYRNNRRHSDNLEPNGLYFIDIDYQDNVEKLKDGPIALDTKIREQDPEFYDENVVLSHVSWSRTGLRYVVKADHSKTYLENCNAFIEKYGLVMDEKCKDMARCSYVPTEDMILKLDTELFSYNNPLTNAEFGGSNEDESVRLWYDGGKQKVSPAKGNSSAAAVAKQSSGSMKNVPRDADGEALYQGKIRYKDIGRRLMDILGGIPNYGNRANRVLTWGTHFKSICDNDVEFMLDIVRELSNGLCDAEIRHQLESSLKYRIGLNLSRQMQLALGEGYSSVSNTDMLDIDYWVNRLSTIPLPKGLKETSLGVPKNLRPGAILAALPCIYTLLSRIDTVFCNNQIVRLNGTTMWVGDSTIGKSHLKNICGKWLSTLRNQDAQMRQVEAQWKKEKEQSNQSKQLKATRPELPIRYLPSNLSTSQLVTRLQNAKDQVPTLLEDGTAGPQVDMPLHLITVEPDMISMEMALKRDYSNYVSYLVKSFDNEDAGQDFKNDTSTNGEVQVYWNQSLAGTWRSFDKLVLSNVGSGMEYRMMIFPAPSSYFQMEEKSGFFDHPEWTTSIEEVAELIGGTNPFWGTIYCPNLITAMDQWCEERMEQAKEDDKDKFLDVIRRRDRQKGFEGGIAYSILENRDKFFNLPVKKLKNGKVVRVVRASKNAIKFAYYIADLCSAGEIVTLKDEVVAYMERQKRGLRNVSAGFKQYSNSTMQQFNRLPERFTKQHVKDMFPDINLETLKSKLMRWKNEGLLHYDSKNHVYIKLTQTLK